MIIMFIVTMRQGFSRLREWSVDGSCECVNKQTPSAEKRWSPSLVVRTHHREISLFRNECYTVALSRTVCLTGPMLRKEDLTV
jgi:hypothetical protein